MINKVGPEAATKWEQEAVKLTLEFVLDFPEALDHAKPALETLAESARSLGRRFDSKP